jgi:hypothetical protein
MKPVPINFGSIILNVYYPALLFVIFQMYYCQQIY